MVERDWRLIRGGRDPGTSLEESSRLVIAATPETAPPFSVDARVFEEDTHLVLSAPARLPDPPEHPIRVMTAVLEDRGVPPGTVVVREGRPMQLLAVVHDLTRDPTWHEDWIRSAFIEVFRVVEKRRVTALGLPLLGTRHGRLAPELCGEILADVLSEAGTSLRWLWLIVREGEAGVGMNLSTGRPTPCEGH